MQTTQYNFIDYIASDCLEHLADKDKKVSDYYLVFP